MVQLPFVKFPFCWPRGAPELFPPCKRHRLRLRTAGHRHGAPARVAAPHLCARRRFRSRVSIVWCIGLISRSFTPRGASSTVSAPNSYRRVSCSLIGHRSRAQNSLTISSLNPGEIVLVRSSTGLLEMGFCCGYCAAPLRPVCAGWRIGRRGTLRPTRGRSVICGRAGMEPWCADTTDRRVPIGGPGSAGRPTRYFTDGGGIAADPPAACPAQVPRALRPALTVTAPFQSGLDDKRFVFRCPPACSPSVMFPRFDPVGGLAMPAIPVSALVPLSKRPDVPVITNMLSSARELPRDVGLD